MKLNKFTWNNGTQSSPIVLTNDQIKKLIAIGQRIDIVSDVKGYVTTNSRKMQKFLKYALTQQFPNLNVVCDEELADTFTLQTSVNTIKEGSRELINIFTDTSITHNFLKWKYEYSNFIIDGDISEQNIKDRIRVENGFLVIDDPQENASWSVTLKLTAYPIYYNDSDFDIIPATSKPDIILTITAKKITDISISTNAQVPINSKVDITVTPVPTDSTKLKGATYTYTTNTPDIININTSSLGTEIITKKQGTGNIIVTLHACNNTVTKSNSTTFTVYDLRPVCFIIDQRYLNGLSDPTAMVSENCILNPDGSLQSISASGSVGNVSNNTLTWIRQNTHAFVSKYVGFSGVRLKQLDDTTRKKFADGTSSVDYISNESGEYDVFIKFGSDIYYKTEAYTPQGQSSPDPDYVLITIARELPTGEDATKWHKWNQYKLIGVYPACLINNKLHSLSGKRAVNNISQIDSIAKAKARGINFNICDYDMTRLFAFLFYGYYSSLNCQQICGYGTTNISNRVNYPKITGGTDILAMTDTDTITGNGAAIPNEDQIKAGIGSDIKSVNFWGLEECWGDLSEWLSNIIVMYAFRPADNNTPNVSTYVADYLDEHDSITITKQDGTDKVYTSKAVFLEDYTVDKSKFLSITDNNNLVRLIDIGTSSDVNRYIKKMLFGTHADIIAKEYNDVLGDNIGFCDNSAVFFAGCAGNRSGNSSDNSGGVGFLSCWSNANSGYSFIGARLLYDGDESTVHIINDETETL